MPDAAGGRRADALMSDVPIGMFSARVDSSALRHHQAIDLGPVKTFAVDTGNRISASSPTPARWRAHRHRAPRCRRLNGRFLQCPAQLVWHEDERSAGIECVSVFCSSPGREQVKVVLTGEGSDELFGGYARYRFYQLNQRWMNATVAFPAAFARHSRSGHQPPMLSASLRENWDIPCWQGRTSNRCTWTTSTVLLTAPK